MAHRNRICISHQSAYRIFDDGEQARRQKAWLWHRAAARLACAVRRRRG